MESKKKPQKNKLIDTEKILVTERGRGRGGGVREMGELFIKFKCIELKNIPGDSVKVFLNW